jgi:predicted transcriptional regulator
MTAALSIRISPEIQERLEREASRLSTTKSKYVQHLLEQALLPKDPVALLMQVRQEYGIPAGAGSGPTTNKAGNVKKLVKGAILRKHGRAAEVDGSAT